MKYTLGNYSDLITKNLNDIKNKRIIERIWQKDFTVWGNKPEEISNRLGWLDCIKVTKKSFDEINSFVEEDRKEGFTDALLMGMGGSSLAPEVFRLTFGVKIGYLDLHVLDSTHPEAILEYEKKLDPNKTLYIVSTKSGGTVETMSFMKYFYTSVSKKLGKEKASKHFIAITDPGSGLEETAKKLNFRKIFLNDPDIGGRFSALSLFGIVPAALIGVDVEKLFDETLKLKNESKLLTVEKNSSAMIGVILGSLAQLGIDKVTFITSPKIKYLGGWLEQLIAESTGKDGKGILPVDLEPSIEVSEYGKDRVFVHIKLSEDNFFDKKVSKIKAAGNPLVEIEIKNIYGLGSEFFRWEFATAVAGYIIGVQPFDQPNVESAKIIARNMVKEFQQKGKLPELSIGNNKNNLSSFLSDLKSGKNYVTIQAYLKPDDKIWQQLQRLRLKILEKYKVATTLGYGPRFLHSTGQLHKGDSGNGFFIQFISEIENDLPIPDEAGREGSSITFGTLIKAQALGDRQALIDNNRKVLTVDIGNDVVESLSKLTV
jgi:glucose-6-phosphate isomerase